MLWFGFFFFFFFFVPGVVNSKIQYDVTSTMKKANPGLAPAQVETAFHEDQLSSPGSQVWPRSTYFLPESSRAVWLIKDRALILISF